MHLKHKLHMISVLWWRINRQLLRRRTIFLVSANEAFGIIQLNKMCFSTKAKVKYEIQCSNKFDSIQIHSNANKTHLLLKGANMNNLFVYRFVIVNETHEYNANDGRLLPKTRLNINGPALEKNKHRFTHNFRIFLKNSITCSKLINYQITHTNIWVLLYNYLSSSLSSFVSIFCTQAHF